MSLHVTFDILLSAAQHLISPVQPSKNNIEREFNAVPYKSSSDCLVYCKFTTYTDC